MARLPIKIVLSVFLISVGLACQRRVVIKENSLGETHPLTGQIYDVKNQSLISQEMLFTKLSATGRLLLGEKHDNPQHHILQAQVIQHFRPEVILMEMLSIDKAESLSQAGDVESFLEASQWAKSGWPNFEIYRPLILQIYQLGLKPLPAHPAKLAVFNAMKQTSKPDVELSRAGLIKLGEDIERAHCGHAPEAMKVMMTKAQQFKDAVMAKQFERYTATNRGVLVAGNGHIRRDYGVPNYITDSLSLGFLEVSDDEKRVEAYDVTPYDFVWFTKRVDNQDPCVKFREQLQKMRH